MPPSFNPAVVETAKYHVIINNKKKGVYEHDIIIEKLKQANIKRTQCSGQKECLIGKKRAICRNLKNILKLSPPVFVPPPSAENENGNTAGNVAKSPNNEVSAAVKEENKRGERWMPTEITGNSEYDEAVSLFWNFQTEKAFPIFEKLAEMNHAGVQFYMGKYYEFGFNIVPKDKNKEIELYRKAADQGFSLALEMMGRCYEIGYGVEKNLTEAIKWYRKAAEHGNSDSKSKISELEGVTLEDGSFYKGRLDKGMPCGTGFLKFPNGDTYEGSFMNGKPHGKGKYTWANGDIYEGNFIQNKMTGRGKKTYKDGRVEEGNFLNGKCVSK